MGTKVVNSLFVVVALILLGTGAASAQGGSGSKGKLDALAAMRGTTVAKAAHVGRYRSSRPTTPAQ
jgi:hypothetical protein